MGVTLPIIQIRAEYDFGEMMMGTLAVFLHPAEGMHGDLGVVAKE